MKTTEDPEVDSKICFKTCERPILKSEKEQEIVYRL